MEEYRQVYELPGSKCSDRHTKCQRLDEHATAPASVINHKTKKEFVYGGSGNQKQQQKSIRIIYKANFSGGALSRWYDYHRAKSEPTKPTIDSGPRHMGIALNPDCSFNLRVVASWDDVQVYRLVKIGVCHPGGEAPARSPGEYRHTRLNHQTNLLIKYSSLNWYCSYTLHVRYSPEDYLVPIHTGYNILFSTEL